MIASQHAPRRTTESLFTLSSMCDTVRNCGALRCYEVIVENWVRGWTAGAPAQEGAMNMDQLWGRIGEASARAREFAGMLIGNRALILQARIDFAEAKAQAAFGDVKSAVQDRRMMFRRARPEHDR